MFETHQLFPILYRLVPVISLAKDCNRWHLVNERLKKISFTFFNANSANVKCTRSYLEGRTELKKKLPVSLKLEKRIFIIHQTRLFFSFTALLQLRFESMNFQHLFFALMFHLSAFNIYTKNSKLYYLHCWNKPIRGDVDVTFKFKFRYNNI